ncbi:hypothetical protein SEK29439_18801 [Salmonella enterica subsp. enterica serovar Kentucky str. 29439]|nr:hypothetical protein SEK29439_18801 [Salmonella enterica subsp. enterica serovar Kentucky str. 29439]
MLCGECCQQSGGLSPLARGTQIHVRCWALIRRFIPAGTGNTNCNPPTPLVRPVYPRWRGEHDEQHARTGVTYGLSPLARGTPR